MIKILLHLFLFINFVLCQNLYYQFDNRLYINSEEKIIKVMGGKYNINSGVISQKGKYLSGFILDNKLQEFISSINKPSIVDFFEIDSTRLIIYSNLQKKIIYDIYINHFPKLLFSPDDSYLLIESWPSDASKLFNLKNRRIEYSFKDKSICFRWLKNNLYFIKEENSHFKLCRYEVKEKICKQIFTLSKDLPDIFRA